MGASLTLTTIMSMEDVENKPFISVIMISNVNFLFTSDFLSNNTEEIAFIHIDTDTYTPAKFILEKLNKQLTQGSIILFDEFFGYPNWQNGEFRAFNEILSDRETQFMAFGSEQAAIIINS